MRAGSTTRQHRRIGGFDRDDLQVRLARLEDLADTGDGSPGTDAGNQDVDLAAGVIPDFLGRGTAMDLGIGRVLELLRDHRVLHLGEQFLGPGDRALHALGAFGENQFGTEQLEHLAPLHRHGLRHGEDQLVALRGGSERQRYAGISRCRLDQRRLAGGDAALRFHRLDHRDADPVLYAGDRVEEFQLGQDGCLDTLHSGKAVEPDERRIADRFGDGVVYPPTSWLPGPGLDIVHAKGLLVVPAPPRVGRAWPNVFSR